jgi:hypothetical protein
MSIEIVKHDINHDHIRIQFVGQIAHRIRPSLFGAPLGDQGVSLTGFGIQKEQHIARAMALVLVVNPFWLARCNQKWWACVGMEFHRLFVKAPSWPSFVVGLCLQVEQRLHSDQELGRNLGDAPTLYKRGLEFVF